jgi:hypothetical protein
MTAITAMEARLNAKFAELAMGGEATERKIGTLANARRKKRNGNSSCGEGWRRR